MKFFVEHIEMISIQEIKSVDQIYWYRRLMRWLQGYEKPEQKFKADYKIYLEDDVRLDTMPVLCGDIVMMDDGEMSLKVILTSVNRKDRKGNMLFIASTTAPRVREDLDALANYKGAGVVIHRTVKEGRA